MNIYEGIYMELKAMQTLVSECFSDLNYKLISKMARTETNMSLLTSWIKIVERKAIKHKRTDILEKLFIAGYLYE